MALDTLLFSTLYNNNTNPSFLPGCDSDVVLLPRVVELCQAPVNEPELSVLVINHDVVGLDVSVHDAHAVAVVQGLQEFVEVVPDVIVGEGLQARKG